jgi:hypothetical protein
MRLKPRLILTDFRLVSRGYYHAPASRNADPSNAVLNQQFGGHDMTPELQKLTLRIETLERQNRCFRPERLGSFC